MPNVQVIDDLALVPLTQTEVAALNLPSLGVITITSAGGGGNMTTAQFATINPTGGYVDKAINANQVPYHGLTLLPGGTATFLRADGTFATPPGQTYGVVSIAAAGLAPALPASSGFNYYLRGDGQWQLASTLTIAWSQLTGIPSTFTPSVHATQHITGGNDIIPAATLTASGLVPILPPLNSTPTLQFLRGDSSWATIPVVTSLASGLMVQLPGTNTTFFRGDGTYVAVAYASLSGIPATFTPTAHAATHITGGSDPIPNFAIGGLANGLVPGSPGGTTSFLRADGSWAAPTGGGGLATSSGAGLVAQLPPSNQSTYYCRGDNSWQLISGLSIAYTQLTGVPVFAGGSAGLVPNSAGGTVNFLRADGVFAAPSGASLATTSAAGIVPQLPASAGTTYFLRGDNTWQLISSMSIGYGQLTGVPSTFTPAVHATQHITGGNDVIPSATATKSGLVPILPSINPTLNFLRGDSAWAPIPSVTTSAPGLAPTLTNITSQWFRADGTYQVIPGVTSAIAGLIPAFPGNLTTFFRGDGTYANVAYTSLVSVPATFTPSAHATQHITAGNDIIPSFTATASGLVPLSGGGTTTFLRADGTWQTPSGAGDVSHTRQILTINSLTGGGDLSADRTLSFVNDVASPGNWNIYSTNGSGVRGWQASTSFPVATSTTSGLVPAPSGTASQFLSGVATFSVPPIFTTTTPGYVPASGLGGGGANFLRADGTWAAPSNSLATTSAAGAVPQLPATGTTYFLRGDNSWQLLSGISIAYSQVTGVPVFSGSAAAGLVPTGSTGSSTTFLSGAATFITPPLAASGTPGYISGLIAPNSTAYWARGDNSWQVLPDTSLVLQSWIMPAVGSTISGILLTDTTIFHPGMTILTGSPSATDCFMEISQVTDSTHLVLLNRGYAINPVSGTSISGGLMFIIGPGILTNTAPGFVPLPPSDATKYLDGSGNWSTPPGSSGTVSTHFSVSGTGAVASPIQLLNDVSSPGPFKFYSTDASGTRGWLPLSYTWETNATFVMPGILATQTITLISNTGVTVGTTIIIEDGTTPPNQALLEVLSVNGDGIHIVVKNQGYAMNAAGGVTFATSAAVTLAGPGVATGTAAGFVPYSSGGTTTFLRADGTFSTPANVTIAAPGYVPTAPNSTTQFLRGDATWAVPTITTLATTSSQGAVPALNVSNQATTILRGDNTWQLISSLSSSINYNVLNNLPSTFAPSAHASSHISTGADAIALFSTSTAVSGLVPGSLSIQFVQAVANHINATAQGSLTVNITGAQTAGNANVVFISVSASAVLTAISDTKGNSYTQLSAPGGGVSIYVYIATNIAAATAGSNTVSLTFSPASDFPDIHVLEYTAITTVSPLDGSVASNTGTGTAVTSGSITTTNAADVIIAYAVGSGSPTTTAGTGFTIRKTEASWNGTSEDQIVASTGTYSPSFTLSTSQTWFCKAIAIKGMGSNTYFLRADATWAAAPTSPGLATASSSGLVPALISSPTLQFLRGDDSWQPISGLSIAYSQLTGVPASFTPSAHASTHLDNGTDPIAVVAGLRTGLVPALPSAAPTTKFLRGDATWTVIPTVTNAAPGLAPAFPNNQTTYLRGDGTYAAVPTATATTGGLLPTPPNLQYQWLRGDATFTAIPFYWDITASFTQPAIGSTTGNVTFVTTTALIQGMVISTVDSGGLTNVYSVASIVSGTFATLTNLGCTGNTAGAGTVNPGQVALVGPPLMTSTGAGTVPISPGGTTTFLRADATWQVPPGSGVPTTRNVNTQQSLTGGGALSSDLTLNLVNDATTPGTWAIYGTNGSGTRGWNLSTALPVATTSNAGLLPTLSGTTNTFLNGQGVFASPSSLPPASTGVAGTVNGLPASNQTSQWLRADNSWQFLPDSNVTTASWTMPAIGSTVSAVTFNSTSNWDTGMTLFFATGSAATCCFMEVTTVTDAAHLVLTNRGYASNPVATTVIPTSMVFVVSPGVASATLSGLVPTPPNLTYQYLRGDATWSAIPLTWNLSATFTQPAIGSTVSGVTFTSTTNMVAAMVLALSSGAVTNIMSVSSVTNSTTAVLTNLGCPGNTAAAGTVNTGPVQLISAPLATSTSAGLVPIPSGLTTQFLRGDATFAQVSYASLTGSPIVQANTTTSANYNQPAVGVTLNIAVTSSTGFLVGQGVLIIGGGYYPITAVPDGTHITILNNGFTYNVASTTQVNSGASVMVVGNSNLFSSTVAGYVPLSGGGTVNFLRADGTWVAAVQPARQILTQQSLTGGGDLSADRTLNLVGDVASPGNWQLYSTNGSGTRGWNASTAFPQATATVAGLVPTPPNSTTQWLRGDATWQVSPPLTLTASATFNWPAALGTVAIQVSSSSLMHVGMALYLPGLGVAEVTVITDATHITIRNNGNSGNAGATSNVAIGTAIYVGGGGAIATATTAGDVPAPPNNTTTFLRGDATFATPPTATATSVGYVSPPNNTTTFLRGDATWVTPFNAGQVSVNFGATDTGDDSVASATVTATWVNATTSYIQVSVVPGSDHADEDPWVEAITAYAQNIINGTSFDVLLHAPTGAAGTYLVNYLSN